jgi:predicted lipid-binding transport protein (Tim44 family)
MLVNRLLALAVTVFAALALAHADFADAARMGGGRSFGMQRSITPPAARTTPPAANSFNGPAANPVMPAKPGATAAAPAAAAGAAAAASPSRASRWLGPIAGLAAGLGLAALFSHFGLSEGLGSLLLVGLLAVGAIVLVRAFLARRGGIAMQPAGARTEPVRFDVPRTPAIEPAWGAPAAAGSSDSATGRYPPGFDAGPFVEQAKQQFHRLQAAYDRGDRDFLADMTTPEMHAEIARDLAMHGSSQPTDVVALDADILEVVREGDRYVATVRFHGLMREDGARDAQPFEEAWNLVKPVDGSSGWLLAGIQQFSHTA